MIKKIVTSLSISLFLLTLNVVYAEQVPIEQLKTFLKTTSSLTAEFKQITLDEKGNPAETSYGEFFLSRPGKFRWSYKKPFIQEIVSSDDKIWFYDADLEQVTIKNWMTL